MTQTERRQYYRTQCEAILELETVDDADLSNSRPQEHFQYGESLDFLSSFHQLDKQAAHLAQSLRANQPGDNQKTLLDYLDIINRKTTCLAHSVAAQQANFNPQALIPINLSESGLCFQSQHAYPTQTKAATRLVFLPHYLSVAVFAQVIRCDQQDCADPIGKSDAFHIALEFLHMNEKDRQIIAQQVMAAQLIAQRQAKKRSN